MQAAIRRAACGPFTCLELAPARRQQPPDSSPHRCAAPRRVGSPAETRTGRRSTARHRHAGGLGADQRTGLDGGCWAVKAGRFDKAVTPAPCGNCVDGPLEMALVTAASHTSVVLTRGVYLFSVIKTGKDNVPRGAQCVLKQPLVPAASCVSKFRANHAESAFATASPVSVGRAVSLQRWPASPHPIRFLAPQPSTFAWATKEPGSSSVSALSAGQPCSTPKKVTNNRLWVSPWAPSPTQAFLRLKFRSMTAADIPGSNCRQGRRPTTRTQTNCPIPPSSQALSKPVLVRWTERRAAGQASSICDAK